MKKVYLNAHGIVTTGRLPMANKPTIKQVPLKQDDRLLIEALDILLEKHRTALVEELVAKMGTIPVALTTENDTIVRHQREGSEAPEAHAPIEIDNSVFVVEQKLDGIEKGFDSLAETKTTKDEGASKSINKLRNLKGKN